MSRTQRPSGMFQWNHAGLIPRGLIVATAVLLLAMPTVIRANPDPGATPAPAVTLLVTDGPDRERLVPLDPATLADQPDATALDLGLALNEGNSAVSADGSTLVTVECDGILDCFSVVKNEIVVRDARTGAERARFETPEPVMTPQLSRNGTRVVVQRGAGMGSAWHAYDTRDGRLLATVESGESWWDRAVIDGDARRLYRLVEPMLSETPVSDHAVPPPHIVAHDLVTGAEIGRVTLPGVLSGTWPRAGMTEGSPVYIQMQPGFSLSPDGRRLAVVHVDREALTLVDAERLMVERTLSLQRPTSSATRLLTLLGLAPRPVAAKFSEGTMLQAVFSPDGRRLYVYGHESVLEGTERQRMDGLGLVVVNVTTGTIVREGMEGELIDRVLPTPDGRSLYVAGPEGGYGYLAWVSLPEGEPERRAYVLRRLDAATLDPLAERAYDGYCSILVAAQRAG